MDAPDWTKDELIAYILLFAANSDFKESNTERNVILSKVDIYTLQDIHEEFHKDNDYQSLVKIQKALKAHNYSKEDINALFNEIMVLFHADGDYDFLERNMNTVLKRLLS